MTQTNGGPLKRILSSILIMIMATGCSKDASAPKLAPRQQRVPVEACYKTDLDLRQLKTSSVRNLITCLNGNEGAIQPYADFLEKSVSDKDLKVLLDIYNKHLVKESRFRKVFDFLDLINKQGMSQDFYKDISYLTQVRSLQTLLPVLAILYQAEESGDRPIDAISEYLRVFIEKEEINRALVSIAKLMGSGRSRWATYMAVTLSSTYPNGVDVVVDDISDGIYQSIQTNGWQEFLLLVTDPILHPIVLQILKNEDGVAKYGSFLKRIYKNENNSNAFESLVELSRGASAPTECWDANVTANDLFGTIFDKLVGYNTSQGFSAEIQQKIPALYFIGQKSCAFDQRIKQNIKIPTLLAREGYADAMFNTVSSMAAYDRSVYLKKLLTSANINSVSSLFENFSHSDIFYYVLEVLEKDMSADDFISFHKMIRNMFIEDLSVLELEKWMRTADISVQTKSYILDVSQQNRFSLHAVIDHMMSIDNSMDAKASYAELILYLSGQEMGGAPGSKLQTVMLKLFGPNYVFRRNLKDFVKTYIESLSREDAGWGDLLASVGEAIVQTGEAPFVDFIKDLINDKDFVVAMNPVLEKYFKDPLFLRALAFTGELSENGELRRLVSFFIQVAKSIDVPGLDIYPSPYTFTKYRGPLNVFKKDFTLKNKINSDYSACWNLLAPSSSELWVDFMKCTNANGSYPVFEDLFTKLHDYPYGNETILSALTRMIDQLLVKFSTYNFFESLKNSSQSLSTLHIVFEEILKKHNVFSSMDKILSNIALDPIFNKTLSLFGDVLSTDNIADLIIDYIPTYENNLPLYYSVPAIFSSTLSNAEELYEIASDWKKDLDYSELAESKGDFDKLWLHSSQNFILRNHSYYYQSGVYEVPPAEDIGKKYFYSEHLLNFLKQSQRQGDLEGLITAFKDLQSEKFSFTNLFHWMVGEQKVIKYYSFSNKKPTIRLVTPADQLEILVQNAQIGVASWAGNLGVDHIATFFQYEIATSTDLDKTLKKLKSKISQGITYETISGNRRKLNNLKNIKETFSVLEDMNAKGHLRFLQMIYKKLLDATPEEYRKKQDPNLNHMGLAHLPSQIGLFSRLVHGLEILESQNKIEAFTISFESMLQALDTDSVSSIRRSLGLLLENDGHKFSTIFDLYWQHSEGGGGSVISENVLSILNLLPTNDISLLSLLKSAEQILGNSSSFIFLSNKLFEIASDKNSFSIKFLNTLNYTNLPIVKNSLLRSILFSQDSLVDKLSYLFVVAYFRDAKSVEEGYSVVSAIVRDEDIDYSRMRKALSDLAATESKNPTILPYFSEILKDKVMVDILANTIYATTKTGLTQDLAREYVNFMIDGDFESLLEYLDAFKPSHSRVSNF